MKRQEIAKHAQEVANGFCTLVLSIKTSPLLTAPFFLMSIVPLGLTLTLAPGYVVLLVSSPATRAKPFATKLLLFKAPFVVVSAIVAFF